ncbi:glycosyltransferase family 28 N-terminal domain protein [Mycobacterium kansasii]|uniref:Glycosyltransferase family 28 N-terminal domain protein n=1 Tax=Mycobacterium kansasii TaxID=1768 RepID=A0A1V3WY33_MYCKA|nr:glycosyltransferase family 28 N-terminal domain protein [Mycobacterium kansasii]
MNDSVREPAGGQKVTDYGPSLSIVLAGGGTAGHVEPAMAVADALSALEPDVRITALGTPRGLETTLVPARGYHLELITPVPLPRKPSGDLARLPPRVWRAVAETRRCSTRSMPTSWSVSVGMSRCPPTWPRGVSPACAGAAAVSRW